MLVVVIVPFMSPVKATKTVIPTTEQLAAPFHAPCGRNKGVHSMCYLCQNVFLATSKSIVTGLQAEFTAVLWVD